MLSSRNSADSVKIDGEALQQNVPRSLLVSASRRSVRAGNRQKMRRSFGEIL